MSEPVSLPMPKIASLSPVAPALDRRVTIFDRFAFVSPSTWAAIGLIVLLVLALYLKISVKLVHDWITIPDYGHGPFIPFFVAYVFWDKRRTLRATPTRPSWAGVPLVAVGLFVLLVGVFGADLFLSRTSFVLLTAGLIWTLLGRAMLVQCKFMLFMLCLAIPLPTLIMNHITFPLQILASEVSSGLLPFFHVPVLREGNVIQLAALPLEVAEACSGIRSLMSLFTVAVIYGYFVEQGWLRRTLLALASVPIAVTANVARIVGTGLCVQYWDPDKALGFFHEFSGWLMFLVSLTCLYLTHSILARIIPEKSRAAQ